MQPEAWLDRLIDAEQADRQVRSLRYQMKAARFPIHRDLTGHRLDGNAFATGAD
jgi:hypothetical protein